MKHVTCWWLVWQCSCPSKREAAHLLKGEIGYAFYTRRLFFSSSITEGIMLVKESETSETRRMMLLLIGPNSDYIVCSFLYLCRTLR